MSWRDRFHEDNELFLMLVRGWLGKIYLYAAALTFCAQILERWDKCPEGFRCTLSFVKGAVWALIWPFYWLNHFTSWVLFRPWG